MTENTDFNAAFDSGLIAWGDNDLIVPVHVLSASELLALMDDAA